MPIEEIDLRGISRYSENLKCTVYIREPESWRDEPWIHLGQVSFRNIGKGKADLIARMDATDFEHDSAYVIVLPIIGLRLDEVYYHQTILEGWICPEDGPDNFHVPSSSDYDPTKLPDAYICEDERCNRHPIVPEGYYVPPFDEKLFNRVRGCRVKIYLGPAKDFEE